MTLGKALRQWRPGRDGTSAVEIVGVALGHMFCCRPCDVLVVLLTLSVFPAVVLSCGRICTQTWFPDIVESLVNPVFGYVVGHPADMKTT